MNEFYNARNPADLWLNVGDLKKVSLVCVTPLNNEFNNCLTGAKMWQSKAHSASPHEFFALKFDVSGQRLLLPPTSSPWRSLSILPTAGAINLLINVFVTLSKDKRRPSGSKSTL